MNVTKAVLTVLALAAGLLVAGGTEVIALPGPLHEVAVGVTGVVGLALAGLARGLLAVLVPLAGVLRLLAVPLVLGLIGWLLVRELRRSRG